MKQQLRLQVGMTILCGLAIGALMVAHHFDHLREDTITNFEIQQIEGAPFGYLSDFTSYDRAGMDARNDSPPGPGIWKRDVFGGWISACDSVTLTQSYERRTQSEEAALTDEDIVRIARAVKREFAAVQR